MTPELSAAIARIRAAIEWRRDHAPVFLIEEVTRQDADLRTLLSALEEAQAVRAGWQDISTAPKDETVVLLYCPESWDTQGVRVGWWNDAENPLESGWFDDEAASHRLVDLFGEPTYWQPLPPPPLLTPTGAQP